VGTVIKRDAIETRDATKSRERKDLEGKFHMSDGRREKQTTGSACATNLLQ